MLGPITGSRKLQAFRVDRISLNMARLGFSQNPSEIGKNAIFFRKIGALHCAMKHEAPDMVIQIGAGRCRESTNKNPN